MSTKSKRKLPFAWVEVTRGTINALPCTVTVAPGTPAPEESVTVPAIFPVIATCAKLVELNATKLIAKASATNHSGCGRNLEMEFEDCILFPLRVQDIRLNLDKRTRIPFS